MFITKIVKKILYVIPLLLGVLLVYGILSGKLQDRMNILKSKIEIEKAEKEEEKLLDAEKKNIPEGKIVLKEYFKAWEKEPKVEVYDPDNKIAKNYVYGITKDEYNYVHKLGMEQIEINETTKLDKEYKEDATYNKEKILKWGEEFENLFLNATCVYDNLQIRDDFKGLNEEYYTEQRDILLSKLDENGRLKDISMWTWKDDTEIVNPECKLVMFDITITPHSEWVTERTVVPYLSFLNDKGDYLRPMSYEDEGYYSKHRELDVTSDVPIYYDLGLYDVDTIGDTEVLYVCPMRKGEVIKFTVGYIVPEELIDNAYFIYNIDGNTTDIYSYLTRDIAIFQLKE